MKNTAVLSSVLRLLRHKRSSSRGRPVISGQSPEVVLSDFWDASNRVALRYAKQRRSLGGLPMLYRVARSDPATGRHVNQETSVQVEVNVSDGTDKWNRRALAHARRRRKAESVKRAAVAAS